LTLLSMSPYYYQTFFLLGRENTNPAETLLLPRKVELLMFPIVVTGCTTHP
jgi:hypothetical protein